MNLFLNGYLGGIFINDERATRLRRIDQVLDLRAKSEIRGKKRERKILYAKVIHKCKVPHAIVTRKSACKNGSRVRNSACMRK